MRVRVPRAKVLPLTNDGELSLFVVGAGGAFSKKLYQNNFLVVKGSEHLMVDCGTRTPEALSRLGHPVTDIKNWLITHSHADHVGGLEEVMLMGRYVAREKPRAVITAEYEKVLWNFTLKGGAEYNESHDDIGLAFGDYWNVLRPRMLKGFPRETYEVNIGDLNIKAVRTNHYPEQATSWDDAAYSIGLILDDRILFTGDTKFDPDLLKSYDRRFKFEYIFHDVQFFNGGVHAGLEQLCTLPESMRERMILMHYPDSFESQAKRVRDEGFLGFAKQGAFYVFD